MTHGDVDDGVPRLVVGVVGVVGLRVMDMGVDEGRVLQRRQQRAVALLVI